jgi:uncharacterized protein with HEPN domain
MPSTDDSVRLRHMLNAARQAVKFAKDRTRAELDTDSMLALSIVRLLEITGEAAKNVSEDLRRASPQIPGSRSPVLAIAWFTVTSMWIWTSFGPLSAATCRCS